VGSLLNYCPVKCAISWFGEFRTYQATMMMRKSRQSLLDFVGVTDIDQSLDSAETHARTHSLILQLCLGYVTLPCTHVQKIMIWKLSLEYFRRNFPNEVNLEQIPCL
jgi:hypothetical protein